MCGLRVNPHRSAEKTSILVSNFWPVVQLWSAVSLYLAYWMIENHLFRWPGVLQYMKSQNSLHYMTFLDSKLLIYSLTAPTSRFKMTKWMLCLCGRTHLHWGDCVVACSAGNVTSAWRKMSEVLPWSAACFFFFVFAFFPPLKVRTSCHSPHGTRHCLCLSLGESRSAARKKPRRIGIPLSAPLWPHHMGRDRKMLTFHSGAIQA